MWRRQKFFCDRLIVFGRYPIPGRTKTRLIPALGPAGAADLQRQLTEKTLKTVRAFARHYSIGIDVCLEGGNEHKMRRWLGSGSSLSRQVPGDLGMRMKAALLVAFQSGCRHVILIGTDIPELREYHLTKAFDALSDHDIVLGPSTDGGYWLIGLKRPINVFCDINWGTGTVLEQTVALAKKEGLKLHLLDPLNDIDTGKDLKSWRLEGFSSDPYVSVIIPTLNESRNIESTIQGARDQDAEVIVVDGGSTDDTVARAIHSGARVETSPQGRALQQNCGAESALGHVLLFLHADTGLPANYVNHVFETLMDPGVVLGAFRFKTDLNRPLMKTVELLTNMRSQYLKLPYGDQCLFMRRSVFKSVDGFPEVPIAEDLFFVRRLSKLGSILISPAYAVTSGRRWQTLGLLRTTLINQIILAGCYLGVLPNVLASLYPLIRRQ